MMGIEVRPLGRDGIEITLGGRLDEGTVGELRPVLLDAMHPKPRLLLNLSRLDAIDAAGMALVMMTRIELEASGVRFVVESSDERIMRTLTRAGMQRFVTIAPRRLDALRALRAAPGSVDDGLAGPQGGQDALGDGVAGESDLLPKEGRLPMSDIAVR